MTSLDKTVPRDFKLDLNPSLRDLQALSDRLQALARAAADALRAGPAPRPFLIATPLGLEQSDNLARLLAEQAIKVVEQREIDDWPAVATALYLRAYDDVSLYKALAFEELWRSLFGGRPASCWYLATLADYDRVLAGKRALRGLLPSQRLRVILPRITFAAGLHAFHLPDPDRIAAEGTYLVQAATK